MSSAADGIKAGVQTAKDAIAKLGKDAKETVTGRPVFAPSTDYNTSYLTTNAGAPITNNEHSLTIGTRGPILLEDHHLLEKLGQFHQEKQPERVVHARGMVAKGHFETTHDISDLTFADFLQPGKKTPVAARFSTVTHERGSPESLRDVRGFSVKFYTQQGNWDFVGNNIPVFFIRDGMQFPDLVHALRPNPKTNIQEGWRILDFLSHHPESCNILTWLLDDIGIPKGWRYLEGYGVNTFTFINKEGRETFIKFHWKPKQGAQWLSDEEAMMVGKDNMRHSHATHDLVNAIANGEYPEWTLYVQTMNPADEDNFYFDPLDCTKVWPEEQFPLREIGKMVLDTNIDNFHAEAEQIAFCPGIAVPGISYSNDKVLQSRIFSYGDAQRYRIGGNYQMLPINQPKCPFHNNHTDGNMNFRHTDEEVNYYPSRVAKKDKPAENPHESVKATVSGQRIKAEIPKVQDDFRQAGDRYRQMDADRKARFEKRVVQWMTNPKLNSEVAELWLEYWAKVDPALGKNLEAKVRPAIDNPKPVAKGASEA